MVKYTGSRRHKLDIYFEILEAARSGSLYTHIAGKARVNLRFLRKYLNFLMSKGLIIERSDIYERRKLYVTSEKGREFIDYYQELYQLITGG